MCSVAKNPSYTSFVAALEAHLELSISSISYLFSDIEILIANQKDLDNAIDASLGGNLSVIIKENTEPKKVSDNICHRFSKKGKCKYGAKCRFIHEAKPAANKKGPVVKEYRPFHTKDILSFLQKKVSENPTPDVLVSKISILQLEDILR